MTGADPGGTAETPDGRQLSGVGRRFTARSLDLLVVLVVGVLVIPFFDVSFDPENPSGVDLYRFALILMWGVYETGFIAWRGRTPGKSVMSIAVVDADTGARPGLSASGVRWIVPVAVLFIPYVGTPGMLIVYLWLLLDFRRQGLHDKASNTLVVKD